MEELGVSANEYRVSFGGDKDVLGLDNDDNCTTPRIFEKLLNCTS